MPREKICHLAHDKGKSEDVGIPSSRKHDHDDKAGSELFLETDKRTCCVNGLGSAPFGDSETSHDVRGPLGQCSSSNSVGKNNVDGSRPMHSISSLEASLGRDFFYIQRQKRAKRKTNLNSYWPARVSRMGEQVQQ